MNKFSHYAMVAIKGLLMGAANVIPGVSGGTIAFLTGIYEELIEAIKAINGKNLSLVFHGKLREAWKAVNGNFLLSLLIGLGVSIFSLAKVMLYLLENHPIQTWAFFFGLVLISTVYMVRQLENVKLSGWISMIIGVICGAGLCLLSPSQTSDSLPFIFLCGAIAMCTMILPGISGSFMLVLLCKYDYIMAAVSNLDIAILAVFALGAAIGILAFSHALSWLLKKAYNGSMMFLSGLMLGSLLKVWPWKTMLESGVERPVLPADFAGEPHLAGAIIWAVVGAALIIAIEFSAKAVSAKAAQNKAIS